MQKTDLVFQVIRPSISDFSKKYPQYTPYANNAGKKLFEFVTSAYLVFKAISATEVGAVAMAGIADDILEFCRQHNEISLSNYTKQYIGAIVCAVMAANGYEKTGKKRSVGSSVFIKGELYKKARLSND